MPVRVGRDPLALLPEGLQLLVDRRRIVGGERFDVGLCAREIYDRSRSLRRSCRIARLGGKRGKSCLCSRQVSCLKNFANGVESLGATSLGKRFRVGVRPVLPQRSQGLVGLLCAGQISTLKSAANLFEIGLTVLIEALELLKNRLCWKQCLVLHIRAHRIRIAL